MPIENPSHAQAIVGEYLRTLESHASADVYPTATRDLPYPKLTIQQAFATSLDALARAGQLTGEMRDYLEVAYVSLADYRDDDEVTLLQEYHAASRELDGDMRPSREKQQTAAWQRVSEQSRLAGEIAKAISDEAEHLRAEYRVACAAATAGAGSDPAGPSDAPTPVTEARPT